MAKKKNLLGNIFGRLKVIDSGESKNGRATWICKCNCGTIKDVIFANIKNGSSTNCGCIRKMKMSKYKSIDSLVGKKYGKLTVVKEIDKNKYGKTICKCVCDCGNTVNVLSNSLRTGHTTSCGCSSSRYPTIIKNELKDLGYNSKLEKTVFLDNDFIPWIRFDVYVDELKLAIEYDGEPHFKPIDWSGSGIEEAIKLLEYTQKRDEVKNKYCYDNDIFILRIPFTEKENIKNLLIETINIITCND